MQIDFRARYTPHRTQIPFHASPLRYKLIGGAMGGGKSVALCGEGIQLSLDVPGNRGAIVRKNRTVLQRTTLVTFFQICPPELIKSYNRSDLVVTLINGSEILFLEADETKDPLFEKLKSLEIGWFAIDEASEVARDAFAVLCSRLRWRSARGKYYGLLASNPEQCWVKDDFIDKSLPDHAFFPALPRDNPELPPEYIPQLESIFDENQRRKYLEGDWNVTDDPMQIVPYTALKNCIATEEDIASAEGLAALGIDVAELGDDKTVFAYFQGQTCTGLEEFSKKRIDEVSDIAKARIIARGVCDIAVDATGNGAGVWGNLVGAGLPARRIIVGESPEPLILSQYGFVNLKAQVWWQMRQDVLNAEVKIPNHQKLIQDLTAPRYKVVSEKKIAVESKDELKKRLGRSPDYGEACVLGNWLRHASAVKPFQVVGGA